MKGLGMQAVIVSMAFSSALMAADTKGSNAIQDAVTVLNGPTNTVTDVHHIAGGKSEVSVTFRSSTDETLAPVTLSGVVNETIKKVYLHQVTRTNREQACEATIVVVELTESGPKPYTIPVKNITCHGANT